MEVTSVRSGPTAPSSASSAQETSDFETFLRMLTTQIQNQDPLSPMQADQFAEQLASFTMVEQQTLTNQRLESLIEKLSQNSLAAYSGLVGQTAVHAGPFEFSGLPVELEIGGVSGAPEEAILVILDERGTIVAEQTVPAGQSRVHWEGVGSDGLAVTPGSYQAELRAESDQERLDTQVATASAVEEVLFGAEVALRLADGTVIPEWAVSRLR